MVSQKRQKLDTYPPYSAEIFRDAVLDYVAAANIPFATVDLPEFAHILRLCRPTVEIPSRSTLSRQLDSRYKRAQQAIRDSFPSNRKVSIAVDVWSSPNNLSFLGIVAYYITDDWEFKETLVAFHPLSGKHSGHSLADLVFKTLKEYGLTKSILTITGDNATSNDTLASRLADLLTEENGKPWNPDCGQLRCLAHILNLSVQRFLKKLAAAPENEKLDREVNTSRLARISTQVTISNTLAKV